MDTDPDPLNPIREYALGLLDRRAYSCGDLAKRLESKGYDRALVDLVIMRLAECGLLDDEALARAMAQATVAKKPASAALIEQKLQARRIPADIVERVTAEVLQGVDPVEAAAGLARDMLATRRRTTLRMDRQRIGAAMGRRGFDADIISEALERVGLTQPLPDESFNQEHGP
jgi:SOS response regulatory protein OraA/RecX